jgi:hypothetical protein
VGHGEKLAPEKVSQEEKVPKAGQAEGAGPGLRQCRVPRMDGPQSLEAVAEDPTTMLPMV